MSAYIQPMIDASGDTAYPYTTANAVYIDISGRTLDDAIDRIPVGTITVPSSGITELPAKNALVFFKKKDQSGAELNASKLFMVSNVSDSVEIATLGSWDGVGFKYIGAKFNVSNSGTTELVLDYNMLR